MRAGAVMLAAIVLSCALLWGCGGGGLTSTHVTTTAAPIITTTNAQNGAVVVSLTAASGAIIYYTVDGSTPTTASQIYEAPFLVASNLTVKAIAVVSGSTDSTVASQTFTPNIPSGTLVWSDEFTNSTSANAQPNPLVWTYDTGNSCCGNNELENYCAWGSTTSPCSPRIRTPTWAPTVTCILLRSSLRQASTRQRV